MRININPVMDSSLDCIQSTIVTAVSYFKHDYMLMFANSWSFDFEPDSSVELDTLGERLKPDWGDGGWGYLSNYHGVEPVVNNVDDIQQLATLIEQELSKAYPLIVNIDAYWCPWNPKYQIQHFPHYCLICGYDAGMNSCTCLDSYYGGKLHEISLDLLVPGCRQCITFNISDSRENSIRWEQIIADSVRRVRGQNQQTNSFEAMRRFAGSVVQLAGFENKVYDSDIFNEPLFWNLVLISSGRTNFSKTLDYIAKQANVPQLMVMSKKMGEAAEKWKIIRLLLLKVFRGSEQEQQLQKIAKKIMAAAEFEENLAYELYQIGNDQYK